MSVKPMHMFVRRETISLLMRRYNWTEKHTLRRVREMIGREFTVIDELSADEPSVLVGMSHQVLPTDIEGTCAACGGQAWHTPGLTPTELICERCYQRRLEAN